jgi:DNA-binding transcriptional regulator YdaS (Cro superfamily)
MHLGTWLALQPRGAKQRLCRLTGLWPNTITDIAKRKRVPSYETARLISVATNGEVTVGELLRSVRLSKLEMRKRAQRRRQRKQERQERAR